PTREAWLTSVELILGSDQLGKEHRASLSTRLGIDVELLYRSSQDEVPDVASISAGVPWFRAARELAEEQRFFHWELAFPEILSEFGRDGFDLVLGNPPWIKATWNDSVVLNEFEPKLGVRKVKSGKYNDARPDLLKAEENRRHYIQELRRSVGAGDYLNSGRLYPELKGSQTNLYKNFIARSWRLIGESGIGSLLHPEGVYEETHGEIFRLSYYPRLLAHYQMRNQLMLFADIGHRVTFSLNIFGAVKPDISFRNIYNLYHPGTICHCLQTSADSSLVPGLKDDRGNWDLRGHASRMVRCGENEMRVFSELFYGTDGRWKSTPLPQVHSEEVFQVLRKFAAAAITLESSPIDYVVTDFFHESGAQKKGEIARDDNPSYQPTKPDDVILTGPHFYVSNPCYQTAREVAKEKASYDALDLTELPEDFLPRTVYRPGDTSGDRTKFERTLRSVGVNSKLGRPIVELPRIVYRRRVPISGERTLTPALVPSGFTGVDTVHFIGCSDTAALAETCGTMSSICLDFLLRAKGKADIREAEIFSQPTLSLVYSKPVVRRTLRLNCLTDAHRYLWSEVADDRITTECFAVSSPLLSTDFELPWEDLDPTVWSYKTPLRTDFSRRQALLEIDVLVAMSLGLTLEELQTIYRVQFPVFRQYELADEYDQQGRRLPNTARKDAGGTEVRAARAEHGDEAPLTVSWTIDEGKQTVTKTFYPPYERFDRESDYREAWAFFSERFAA
ncbi:MAG: hypothetical protein KDD69_06800, partial [Bdellovibrionales bacterium]|nr:hypothetical protein [Bdellovibrionales bacterium]